MPNSLVVGSSSQISHYYPHSYARVSSRGCLDDVEMCRRKWESLDTVYLCFGENRTYLANTTDAQAAKQFYDVNFDLTMRMVDAFAPISRRVVVYSTAELWNDCTGAVDANVPFQFHSNHYILSKYNLTIKLRNKREYPNVSIAYPFNFNGIHRKGEFLFGKVFDSILNNKKIQLGDTYYYRDLLHPSMAVDESMRHGVGEDFMIGFGRVVFVNDLIRSLYAEFKMNYDDMVEEKITSHSHYRSRIFYSASPAINTQQIPLLEKMVREIKGVQNANRSLYR